MIKLFGDQYFEWDEDKEKKNIRKHGIDFETALKVFGDDERIEYLDDNHSTQGEYRYATIGMIYDALFVVTVFYTERTGAIRIISARRATTREEEEYYGN